MNNKPMGILTKDPNGSEVKFIPFPTKPILVIYLKMATLQQIEQTKLSLPEDLKDQYHVLVLMGEKNDVKVFFQKDQVELDKEQLEKLLSVIAL